MKSIDKISIFIPVMLLSVIGFAVFSTILPENQTLIIFGILSGVMITAIIIVHRMPNPAPEDYVPSGSEYSINTSQKESTK